MTLVLMFVPCYIKPKSETHLIVSIVSFISILIFGDTYFKPYSYIMPNFLDNIFLYFSLLAVI